MCRILIIQSTSNLARKKIKITSASISAKRDHASIVYVNGLLLIKICQWIQMRCKRRKYIYVYYTNGS